MSRLRFQRYGAGHLASSRRWRHPRNLQQLSTRFVLHYHSLAIENLPTRPSSTFKPNRLGLGGARPSLLGDRAITLAANPRFMCRCNSCRWCHGTNGVCRLPSRPSANGDGTVCNRPQGRNWQVSALLPDDALQPDNRRDLVISVRPQVRVVTVESTSGACAFGQLEPVSAQ